MFTCKAWREGVGGTIVLLLLSLSLAQLSYAQGAEEGRKGVTLQGADAPFYLCVKAFLIDRTIMEGTLEKRTLAKVAGVDDDEWEIIVDTRMASRRVMADVRQQHANERELAEPLKLTDAEAYEELRDAQRPRMMREKLMALGELYRGMMDQLDHESQYLLNEYLQPGSCGGVQVTFNTSDDAVTPWKLALFEDFVGWAEGGEK